MRVTFSFCSRHYNGVVFLGSGVSARPSQAQCRQALPLAIRLQDHISALDMK
jgi:hypothetical protein